MNASKSLTTFTHAHKKMRMMDDLVAVVAFNVGTAIMYIEPKKERRVYIDISSRINKETLSRARTQTHTCFTDSNEHMSRDSSTESELREQHTHTHTRDNILIIITTVHML